MFKIYNNDAMVNGTSLQGHIEATYDDLVKAFGAPAFDSVVDGESDPK